MVVPVEAHPQSEGGLQDDELPAEVDLDAVGQGQWRGALGSVDLREREQ